MKELSLKEVILINGGETTFDSGTLPEVVVVGHKKTFWEKLIEYTQSIPALFITLRYRKTNKLVSINISGGMFYILLIKNMFRNIFPIIFTTQQDTIL